MSIKNKRLKVIEEYKVKGHIRPYKVKGHIRPYKVKGH